MSRLNGINAKAAQPVKVAPLLRLVSNVLELSHLDSVNGTFVALVAILAAAAVESLLLVVVGEQALNDRYLACSVESGDAVCHSLADIVEVRSLTAYYAAQYYHSVVAAVQYHLVGAVYQLKATRNCLYVYVLRQSAVLLKSLYGSVEQSACYLGITFSHNNAEAHVA